MMKFLHVDSPKIFYDGKYTEYGEEVIEDLKRKYTGHLYDRLYLGNWVGVSGAVYGQEYDPNRHDVEEDFILNQIEKDWHWTLSMDFGFRHPFVCSLFVGPPDRSKLYHFKEVYITELDPDETKKAVHDLVNEFVPGGASGLTWAVADHKPEYHKTLEKIGIPIENAEKEILPGIAAVKECLNNDKIFFNKESLSHDPDHRLLSKGHPTRSVEEFEVYAYKPEEKQTGAQSDEIPVPLMDDFCDALRYQIVKWTNFQNMFTGVVDYIEPHVPDSFLF